MPRRSVMKANPNGFSVVEMTIWSTLMSLIIFLAIPIYSSAMDVAEETSAIDDIQSISNAIDTFQLHHGTLPNSLDQVAMQHVRDPWGNFYIYKKLDPAYDGEGSIDVPGTKAAIFQENDDGTVSVDVDADGQFDIFSVDGLDHEVLEKLAKIKTRLDSELQPLNSDYDLYSIGEDNDSDAKLNSPSCEDDIIRGRNGGFVNRANKY